MPFDIPEDPTATARFAPSWRREYTSVVGDYWHFLRAFALRPGTVGAIAPSSRRLAEAMIPPSGLASASVVVELGAGTGAITGLILERVRADTSVISLELDPAATLRLQARFHRVSAVCDSAENVLEHVQRLGHSGADCIISSLPWRSMPGDVRSRVLNSVSAALRPGGTFCAMAYLHASIHPAARHFEGELRRHFGRIAKSRIVWANLPPAFVYYAKSPGAPRPEMGLTDCAPIRGSLVPFTLTAAPRATAPAMKRAREQDPRRTTVSAFCPGNSPATANNAF